MYIFAQIKIKEMAKNCAVYKLNVQFVYILIYIYKLQAFCL